MPPFILSATLVLAAISTALLSGVYFAFSTFVMTALARLPTEQAMAAMNSINATIIRSPFMLLFLGAAVLSVALAVMAVSAPRTGASLWIVLGSASYLATSFGVTMIFNVPLNDQLETAPSAALWSSYADSWTWWNHIRTAASIFSAFAFVRSLMLL